MKKDEKTSDYKNLSVDAETYKRIGELSKKDSLTKLRCIYYMTRYFHENDLSVIPGNQVSKDTAAALIKQDTALQTERVIRLLKAFEKEYFRPIVMKSASTDIHLQDVVCYLQDKQMMEHHSEIEKSEDNKILTNPSLESAPAQEELERLRNRNRELEIESQRKGLLLKTATELLDKVISPSFCALTERSEFAARTRKFRSQDVEEIMNFIKQCPSQCM